MLLGLLGSKCIDKVKYYNKLKILWYRYVHEKEYLCTNVTNFLYLDRKQCFLDFNVRKSYNFVGSLGFNSKIILTQSHKIYINLEYGKCLNVS